ncbi:hypothetical protein [Frankia sp. AvcI1]|uniref:hypothetical protein n=1 Tax=Frankia sp. AvcI1 TaxID=573496 RepID=UPI002118220C|nr:hypothetical protein [Frankia sp. AvcI1]
MITVEGADRVAASLLATAVTVQEGAATVVAEQGAQLRTAVQAHASGRPGPEIVTGAFHGGIALEVEGGVSPSAEVSSDAPQAFRLEFGFNGADSLGRVYHQPPYPSFGPAFDEVSPGLYDELAAMVTAAVQ